MHVICGAFSSIFESTFLYKYTCCRSFNLRQRTLLQGRMVLVVTLVLGIVFSAVFK